MKKVGLFLCFLILCISNVFAEQCFIVKEKDKIIAYEKKKLEEASDTRHKEEVKKFQSHKDELENKFSEFESMPVYFDNPSSREMFLEFKNNILLSRNKFLELIDRLLLFSKKKYIIIEETEENET